MPEYATMPKGSMRRASKNKEGAMFTQANIVTIRELVKAVKAGDADTARAETAKLYRAAIKMPGLSAFTIGAYGLTPEQAAQIHQFWQSINGSLGKRVTCDIEGLRN